MSKNLPLVSIALCVYNGEKFLKEQLDSLFAQTHDHIEIVAVDDCSNDRSVEILNYYLPTGKIRIYKNTHNMGFVKNFEKCLRLCHGEFIALCDQDDYWDPSKIQKLLANIGDSTLIYSDSLLVDETGNSLHRKISDQRVFYRGNDFRPFIFTNCISGHVILMRSSLVPKLFPFHENIFHDAWIAYVAATTGSIGFISEPLVHYRQHATSQTDMLQLKKRTNNSTGKAGEKKQKISNFIYWLSTLENCTYNTPSQKQFIRKLKEYYLTKNTYTFSLGLFFFLLKNRHSLLYCKKKSKMSKLNFMLQESKGLV